MLYDAAKMNKDPITVTKCVYNWTDMMVDMSRDNILHHDRYIIRVRTLNACIRYWESDILRTLDQENDQ